MEHPGLPVLMYHKVGYPVVRRRDTFLNVSAVQFRRQMRALSSLGYRPRLFADVVEAVAMQKTLPPRTFAVTFDDGYQAINDIAAPILKEFDIPATVFVVGQGAGQTNSWDAATRHPVLDLMGWDDLRCLLTRGWEVGGHTLTHPYLDRLPDADALANIRAGKEVVEAELRTTLRTFCYPYGFFSLRTPALVAQAGFAGACTTRSGVIRPNYNPYLLPRVKISYHDGVFGMLFRMLVRPHLPNVRRWRKSHRTRISPELMKARPDVRT